MPYFLTIACYLSFLVLCRKEEAVANAKHIVAELEKQGEPAKSALVEAQKDLANLEESLSISSPEATQ